MIISDLDASNNENYTCKTTSKLYCKGTVTFFIVLERAWINIILVEATTFDVKIFNIYTYCTGGGDVPMKIPFEKYSAEYPLDIRRK